MLAKISLFKEIRAASEFYWKTNKN